MAQSRTWAWGSAPRAATGGSCWPGWSTCTGAESPTATSSPRTCCSTTATTSRYPTSEWPRCSGTGPASGWCRPCAARRRTPRPRCWAPRRGPTARRPPTSGPRPWCCSRCWQAGANDDACWRRAAVGARRRRRAALRGVARVGVAAPRRRRRGRGGAARRPLAQGERRGAGAAGARAAPARRAPPAAARAAAPPVDRGPRRGRVPRVAVAAAVRRGRGRGRCGVGGGGAGVALAARPRRRAAAGDAVGLHAADAGERRAAAARAHDARVGGGRRGRRDARARGGARGAWAAVAPGRRRRPLAGRGVRRGGAHARGGGARLPRPPRARRVPAAARLRDALQAALRTGARRAAPAAGALAPALAPTPTPTDHVTLLHSQRY